MKELKINQIKIKDWCSIDTLVINAKNIINVSGDNETGKSTVGSSVTWVLNGTDINGNTLSDVLPFNREEDLSPTVTLEMSVIDDKGIERPVTLEKSFKAGRTKRKEYNGEHTNTFKLNDVVVTQKAVNEWVNENVCNVEVFNLLSNVKVFTEKLKTKGKETVWQVQRRIITSLINDLMDELELVQTNKKYELLKDGVLRNKTAAEYLKSLKSKQSALEKEVEDFPIILSAKKENLEEVKYSLKELSDMETRTKSKFEEVQKANQEYREKQSSDANKEVLDKIKYLQIENDTYKDEYSKKYGKYVSQVADYKENDRELNTKIEQEEKRIEQAEEVFVCLKSQEEKTNCELCGASLSDETLKQNRKSKNIRISEWEEKIKSSNINITNLSKEILKNKNKLDSLIEPRLNKQVESNNALISELQKELVEIKPVEDMEGYQEKIQTLTKNLSIIALARKSHENNAKIEKQIADMQENHKQSMKELSELQMLHDLCKELIKDRCETIETKANEMFADSGISFKMFKDLKTSDEPKETFEIYFNGKEYSKQLSLSTQTIVSYLITMALQKAYGVKVPLVIDNVESIALEPILSVLDTQAMFLTRTEEKCPICLNNKARRGVDGLWHCECGNVWSKELKVEVE